MVKQKSSVSNLRQKMSSEALLERTAESHRRKNDYGKFGRFFRSPEGSEDFKEWKCKEGEHIIDIIPFLAGKNHPHTPEGSPTYLIDVWVHQKVGINENDYVCMARNYNKPCPICDYINAQKSRNSLLSPEEEQSLNPQQQALLTTAREAALSKCEPKRRCLYNIVCYDSTKEQDSGVFVWEIAHFLFEKKILAIAREPRGGGFIPFTSPDNGKSIYFERQGSGSDNTQYLGHKFIDRPEPISDKILESAFTLDELILVPSYEDLRTEFLSGPQTRVDTPQVEKKPTDNIPEAANAAAGALKRQREEEAAQAKRIQIARDAKEKATRKQPPIKPAATATRPPAAAAQVRPTIKRRKGIGLKNTVRKG
jgi:hypothetical protein